MYVYINIYRYICMYTYESDETGVDVCDRNDDSWAAAAAHVIYQCVHIYINIYIICIFVCISVCMCICIYRYSYLYLYIYIYVHRV